MRTGRRIALLSIGASAGLAVLKIAVGLRANSTAVVSDGLESASDVLSSGIVLFGLYMAARPPDDEHPYGHGRLETLSALLVGGILIATGALICFRSLQKTFEPQHAPQFFAVWPLGISIAVKGGLWGWKKRVGRKMRSDALLADATNDAVDVLSALVALCGLSIALVDTARLGAFDHFGGFAVGLIVMGLGGRVGWETALQLMDTSPGAAMLGEIKQVAMEVPGVLRVEKCFARKTGFQYHVDLHVEVDPAMTVKASHAIARQVRIAVKENLDWVADVLIHVEPDAGRGDGK